MKQVRKQRLVQLRHPRWYSWFVAFLLSLSLTLWGLPGHTGLMSTSPSSPETAQAEARQFFEIGKANYEQGQFSHAAVSLAAAAQLFEAQADWPALAATLMNLGRSQFAAGQLDTALETWQTATTVYRARLQDANGVAQSQIYQAQAQQELGLYPQACQTVTQSLPVNSQLCLTREETAEAIATITDRPEWNSIEIEGWRVLGAVLRLMGRLEDSQQILETLTPSLSPSASKDAVMLALGNTYRAVADRDRDRALPQKFDFMPWRCQITSDLPARASKYYQQAEQTYGSLSNSRTETIRTKAQLNRLRLLSELGNVAAANKLLQAINVTHLPPDRTRIYARIQVAKSQACIQQQETPSPAWEGLTQQVNQALQEADTLGDVRAKSYTRGNLGGLLEYRAWWLDHHQNLAQAQQWRQQAIELTEQALYQAQPGEFADIAYRWQWQQGRLLKAQGENTAAIAAYKSAIATLESVRGDLLAINSDVQFSFRDNVEPIYRELVDLLLLTQEREPSPEKLQDILGNSLYYVESLQLAELENFLQCNVQSLGTVRSDRFNNQTHPSTALIDRIEQIFQNDPSTALIYPILLQDRIAIIAKRPGQAFRYHATPVDYQTVETTLNQLQAYLKNPSRTNAIRDLSAQVYQWLIAPLEITLERETEWDTSDVKNLVFVLDGSLRNIPMSMLYDQRHQQYLLERYSIAISSGLQVLDATHQTTPVQALVGGLSEKREFGDRTFSALMNVPAELASIQAVVPSQQLLNQGFNRRNLRSQLVSTDYSVVHMATHGNFSSDPEETFLVLSDQQLQASALNDLLRVNAGNRDGQIDLLVLSACETATGDKRAALGLAGLALRAGARSTLATLWQVNDASTAALMSQFYTNLNNDPEITKAEALRQAQLSLWQETSQDWAVPFFWAAYVLVGNWL